ncbi:MAG: PSD1 and planctomycete cytochrome C domain-containing protein [Pirellulales bacterium]
MTRFARYHRNWALAAGIAALALGIPGGPASADEAAAAKVDFARDIGPIFVEHCYECHGPDAQESGLRLDQRDAALAGGDSGALFVAGKSGESELIRRITVEGDERMPPVGDNNKPLSAEQVATLKAWVDAGGAWPAAAASGTSHWSFQPIARPEAPAVQNAAWPRSPLDRFVLARLEAQGIAPSPEADRYTLIKRLTYDLLGLPPEPRDVDAFVNDASPDAYERLVDRLLDSPHFGERWGRHWLDMARYADSDGYEKDNSRPDAWRYRDWVIEAVNNDLPLDRFTIEQLAGDLLPGANASNRLATAFHRQTLTNTEGGTDQEQWRVEAIFDRVATTGSVWLGLTVGCAQCHTHKYDPISHHEFYQLFAFFNNGDEVETEVPLVGEPLAEWRRDKEEAAQQLTKLEPKLAQARQELAAKVPTWEAELKAKAATPLAFHPVELLQIASKAGAQFKMLSDGSYLAAGENSDTDEVTITAKTDLPEVTGFRIEALAHDSLGGRGPGRTGHGNFVLGELRVAASDSSEFADQHRVKLAHATAAVHQNGFPPENAIDGKENTGWAIGPKFGQDHAIALLAEKPIRGDATPNLQLVLSQNYGGQHTLGRFRVMAVSGHDPLIGVPQNVRDVLVVAADQRTPEQTQALVDFVISQDKPTAELAAKVEKLQARATARGVMKARVVAERSDNRRTTHVLHRGDFLQPKDEVRPSTLAALPPIAARGETPDRLDLANWLVDPDHPLVPRVTVNHLWSNLFGQGIVKTAGDFGVRGERPTHPELLDWLASELIARGWSRKEMIRAIVSSATYRQSSATRPELVDVDPTNRLLSRQNRYRVEGEIVRDLSLAVSGLLSPKLGGPSVFPPLPAGIAELSYANNFKWKTSEGEDRFRRGMYTYFKRTAPHPSLTTFDCPDSNTTCLERQVSNTPLQALTTLNNEVYAEAAQALARRLILEGGSTDAERLTQGLRWCIARPPTSEELAPFAELLSSGRQWFAQHPHEAKTAVGAHPPEGVAPDEAAAWVATGRILLNLDEFLTRE